MHVLALEREIAGALPLPHVLEHGPFGARPIMGRRRARGIEELAACGAREGAEGHGRVGHAEGGEADCGQGLVEGRGRDAERVHVRGLALVGRHAGRGVALDVLDRAEALAHGELHILRGHIVLEIDEGFHASQASGGAARARGGRRRGPWKAAPADAPPRCRRPPRLAPRLRRPPRRRRSPRRGRRCPGTRRRERMPSAPPSGRKAFSFSSKRSLPRACEKRWMRRREAAAHQHEVAGDARARADLAVAADGRDLDRGHPVPSARGANRGRLRECEARRRGLAAAQGPDTSLADVDDRRDLDAARGKLDRGAVSLVMGGRHHRARAGLDGVARKILARRVGEHDARAVVVGKDERALERARREHHLLGAHLPEPLARAAFGRRRQMVA